MTSLTRLEVWPGWEDYGLFIVILLKTCSFWFWVLAKAGSYQLRKTYTNHPSYLHIWHCLAVWVLYLESFLHILFSLSTLPSWNFKTKFNLQVETQNNINSNNHHNHQMVPYPVTIHNQQHTTHNHHNINHHHLAPLPCASCTPVEAPEGTAAVTVMPPSVTKST